MRKHLPLIALVLLCIGSVLFNHGSTLIADTMSYFYVNPNAGTAIQANAGPGGRASVGTHGEQFVTLYGTPQPEPALLAMTPGPAVSILATAVPTVFPTPQATTSAAAKFMQVCNGTNQDIVGAYNLATVPYFRVRVGDCYYRNWAANKETYNGPVAIARPGTLPTSGEVSIWFEY